VSSDQIDAESTVSGDQATIPARIRDELGVNDGDQLRWNVTDDGTLRVEVVNRQSGTFTDFDGYSGDTATDVASDHDDWGVNE
jgi:bifunctional DNA-binding transcriptional regulator/antitoxin component of YhaV-PrlF toxin-antitoxin module